MADTKPTYEELAAENAGLKKQLAALQAAEKQRTADEKAITEKMSKGLSREQAINVITRQREFDNAKKAASTKPAKK